MTESDRTDQDSGGAGNDVVRADYDWETTSPSAAVIETVAAATDREPTAIGPLFDAVDPDALDAFVAPSGASSSNDTRLVSFEFSGRYVTVHATGEVTVQPPD